MAGDGAPGGLPLIDRFSLAPRPGTHILVNWSGSSKSCSFPTKSSSTIPVHALAFPVSVRIGYRADGASFCTGLVIGNYTPFSRRGPQGSPLKAPKVSSGYQGFI
jgi:hypothetical protein